MENIIKWNVGLNGFKKCTLEVGKNKHIFATTLQDYDFESNRNIMDIFNDHLSVRQSKYVEVLYSGGLDSELTLLSCIRNKIPVKAITLAIKIKGVIINTHDLYYAQKFCIAHNIEHKIIELATDKFFENGTYLDYLTPYHITDPHIATHLWLIEQCSDFPIIGGDWPWVQAHLKNKVLSPFKLEHSSYERFMKDKGIYGIGNMISYSLESSCKFIQLHLDNYQGREDISDFKARMYQLIEPVIERRFHSFGWENTPFVNFDLFKYKIPLLKLGTINNTIKWGNTISSLLNTTVNDNASFG
jgi:hypothetical protein